MARGDPNTFRKNVNQTNFFNEQSTVDKQSSILINVGELQGEPQWTHDHEQLIYKGSLYIYLIRCDSLDSFNISTSLRFQ